MAHIVFAADAPLVAQESRVTPANVNIGNTFTITINGKSITFTATAATVANVTAGLLALFSASVEPEFTEITASDETTYLKLLANTAGIPFTSTSAATGGTAANVTSTPTTASGPECVVAANFKDVATAARGLPTAADTLWLQDTDVSLKYFLDALSGVGTLTNIFQEASYLGEVGLPEMNPNGYREYRPRFFDVRSNGLRIGNGLGQGSGRSQYNMGSVQTAALIFTASGSVDADTLAIQILGTHASNTLTVRGGSVDIARGVNEAATFATITTTGDAQVRLSSAVTWTTINASENSSVLINSNGVTLNTADNAVVTKGNGNISSACQIYGQSLIVQGSGSISGLVLGAGKTLDCSSNTAGVTIGSGSQIASGATINDPNGMITWGGAFLLALCGLQDITYNSRQTASVLVSY